VVYLVRFEDRIRQLCAQVVAAPESELKAAIAELQNALREHPLKMKELAVSDILKREAKPDHNKP